MSLPAPYLCLLPLLQFTVCASTVCACLLAAVTPVLLPLLYYCTTVIRLVPVGLTEAPSEVPLYSLGPLV